MARPTNPARQPATPWSDPTRPEVLLTVLRHPVLLLFVAALAVGAGVAYLKLATPQYTSSAKLRVQLASPRLVGEIEAPRSSEETSSFLNSEVTVITSAPVLALALPSIEDPAVINGLPDSASYLRKQLRVRVGRKDGLISVEYDSPSPQTAARVVGAVIDAYSAYASQQKQSMSERLMQILSKEKADCEAAIAQKNEQMLELARQANAPALGAKDNSAILDLQAIRNALRAAQWEASQAETACTQAMVACLKDENLLKRIEQTRAAGTALVGTEVESSQLRLGIADLELKLAELTSRQAGANHPQVKAIQTQLDQMRVLHAVSAQNRLAQARQREQQLADAVRLQQDVSQQLANAAARHAQLELELNRLARHSDTLAGRINELRASEGSGALNITVLEPALPALKPSKPSKLQVLFGAAVAGLMLGAMAAYWRGSTDPRVRTVEQVRQCIDLPIIGSVPRIPPTDIRKAMKMGLPADPFAATLEAFRMVRAGLRLAGVPGEAKAVMFTSPQSGDGRTTLVSCVGLVLAQAGQRVLIIDGDLRNPRQHGIFDVNQQPGLSNVMLGEEPIDQAVQPTSIERLDVLAAGGMTDDPLAVVSHSRLGALLDELSPFYDVILVDAPPMCISMDSRVLSSVCDATVLVVELNQADRQTLERCAASLAESGGRLLGVVTNDVPRRRKLDVGAVLVSRPALGMGPDAGKRPRRSLPLISQDASQGNTNKPTHIVRQVPPQAESPDGERRLTIAQSRRKPDVRRPASGE